MRAVRAALRLGMRAAGLALGLLLAALLLGALLPRNPGWREAETGIAIGVDATLAHAEIIVPVAVDGHDWRAVLPPGSVPPGTTHLGFSWGERAFFLATPTWAEFDPRLGLKALFGRGESLVHLYRLAGPRGARITLTPDEYQRLVAFLEAEIADGAAIPGYGADDIFLPGTARYSWARTCNDWAADALAAAGVRVGLWTPFAQGFMWRFEDEARRG